MPELIAFLVIIGESIGALALALGLFTRLSAASLAVIMFGALAVCFFMNWGGQHAGERLEFHVLVIGMALALVANGGGKWSLDRLIAEWIPVKSPARMHAGHNVAPSVAWS